MIDKRALPGETKVKFSMLGKRCWSPSRLLSFGITGQVASRMPIKADKKQLGKAEETVKRR